MFRALLFVLTNLSILLILSIVCFFTGIHSGSVQKLLLTSLLFGFTGSFISLFFSKWIAIKSVNAHVIKKANNTIEKWLINEIVKQSEFVGIKTPELAIYESVDINAFATGATQNSALIAVSTGLLKNMKKNEIQAVLAHEMSHIKSGDMVTMTLLQGIVNTFVIFFSRCAAQFISQLFTKNTEQNENLTTNFLGLSYNTIYHTVSIILELTLGILASIITLWYSRRREFFADSGAAQIVGKEKMIDALLRLQNNYESTVNNSIIAFCINGKKKKNNFTKWFATHPSLSQRIRELKKI
ncbi:protease HtpX [Buchnera aphidicola (Thelaxes californica)]|uniref:Protease HtpX n=1 Tax=Buchnera aphidicola (Thelaxes californica) TaxID=1315998 RepID=A0A4D6YJQ8_9GAMM|nr:protease HtpX [Buchnera aphidicola]QCI26781.1 protease HtpX [Buchnera aphidicola (Thelaxes californica)]